MRKPIDSLRIISEAFVMGSVIFESDGLAKAVPLIEEFARVAGVKPSALLAQKEQALSRRAHGVCDILSLRSADAYWASILSSVVFPFLDLLKTLSVKETSSDSELYDPITMEPQDAGFYCGGQFHCLSLKTLLKHWLEKESLVSLEGLQVKSLSLVHKPGVNVMQLVPIDLQRFCEDEFMSSIALSELPTMASVVEDRNRLHLLLQLAPDHTRASKLLRGVKLMRLALGLEADCQSVRDFETSVLEKALEHAVFDLVWASLLVTE